MDMNRDLLAPKFRVLNAYRALLSIGLLAGFHFLQPYTNLGTAMPQLYLPVALLYTIWGCVLYWTSQSGDHIPSHTIGDTLFILLLSTASGGLESGLPYLALPMLMAEFESSRAQPRKLLAWVVISIFIMTEFFLFAATGKHINWTHLITFPSIVLLLVQFRHIDREYSVRKAQQSKTTSAKHSALDRSMLEHLDIGIITLTADRRVRYMNQSAWYMLGLPSRSLEMTLNNLSSDVNMRLAQWQKDPNVIIKPFQSGIIEICPRFTVLNSQRDIMITLENQDRYDRQSRNIKHTALGRLTMSIAHEIRNPLGAIGHASQLLGESRNLDSSDKRLNQIVIEQSQRMNAIIENIMQLGRQNNARSQTFLLKSWLQNFKSEFERTHDMEGFYIDVDVTPENSRTVFDQTHLFQMLSNLCQNSIRHSESSKKVIHIRGGHSRDSEGLFLDVIDYGKGINPEQAQHIYEPFYTSDSRGTGLGLYISRELAEANHGRLEYVPVPTGGSCFRIRLPDATVQENNKLATELSAQ